MRVLQEYRHIWHFRHFKIMSINDHYDINPPGTDRFKDVSITVKHMDKKLLLQVKNPSRVKIYS